LGVLLAQTGYHAHLWLRLARQARGFTKGFLFYPNADFTLYNTDIILKERVPASAIAAKILFALWLRPSKPGKKIGAESAPGRPEHDPDSLSCSFAQQQHLVM